MWESTATRQWQICDRCVLYLEKKELEVGDRVVW